MVNTLPSNARGNFSGGSVVKNLPGNAEDTGDSGSIPGSGRSPGGGNGNSLQYSCLEKSHGWRSLEGYSPSGCKELDTTEATWETKAGVTNSVWGPERTSQSQDL